MTTGGVDPLFIDTNVLVFATVPAAPHFAIANARLLAERAAGRDLWISRQIIREYLATLSRPQVFTPPFPAGHLVREVQAFQTQFLIADDVADVTDKLLALVASTPIGGRQIHDANVVATMQTFGVRELLTDNTADFARYGSLITVLPLIP